MSPLGYGLFESDGEVVLGVGRPSTATRPAAARRRASPRAPTCRIAPTTLENLATRCADLPTPWPPLARGPLQRPARRRTRAGHRLGGAGPAGIIERWLPEWAAVRSRPAAQRRPPPHRRPAPDRDRRPRHRPACATSAAPTCCCSPPCCTTSARSPARATTGAPARRSREAVMRRLGHAEADVAGRHVARARAPHPHRAGHPARPRRPRDHRRRRSPPSAATATGFELLLALTEADAVAAGPEGLDRLARGAARPARHRGARPARPGHAGRGAPREPGAGAATTVVPALADGGAARRGRRPTAGPTGSTSSTVTGWGCSPTPPGCSPRRGSSSGPRSCAPSTGSRPTSGTSSRRAATRRSAAARPRAAPPRRGRPRAARALERRRSSPPGRAGRRRSARPGSRARSSCRRATEATVLEVRAQDRPGLLHELGMTFAKAGLTVRSAHIATYAGQTLDTSTSPSSGSPARPGQGGAGRRRRSSTPATAP